MDETKVLAAILAIATSAREPRNTSQEVGKENWRKVVNNYEEILKELKSRKL